MTLAEVAAAVAEDAADGTGGGVLMVKIGDRPGGPPGEIIGLFCSTIFICFGTFFPDSESLLSDELDDELSELLSESDELLLLALNRDPPAPPSSPP